MKRPLRQGSTGSFNYDNPELTFKYPGPRRSGCSWHPLDAFNALNIASYGNPDTGVANTTFGQIASQGTPVRSLERHLHFSARHTF